MVTAEQRNQARAFLKKAEEYLGSAEDNLAAERNTRPLPAMQSTLASARKTPSSQR